MTSIHVYSRNRCVQCNAVKRWLKEKGIPYTETNIDDLQQSEADEILEMIKGDGHLAAPVVYFTKDGVTTSFGGFNVPALEHIRASVQQEAA